MEMELPDVGLVTVEDSETGEQIFIDTSDPAYRERYAAIAQQQEAALREALGRSGADVLELATDDDLLDAMLRFAQLRRSKLRMKAPLRYPKHLRQAEAFT
jgi:uncharacterized protein (DUF58 family)